MLVFLIYLRVDIPNYPAFLLSWIFPWLWFSASLSEATQAIIGNGGLIRKVYLPSEVFPLGPVGSNRNCYLEIVQTPQYCRHQSCGLD